MKKNPEAAYVRLTTEESGVLCHTLLRALMDSRVDLSKPSREHPPQTQRVLRLYNKLCLANDYTMGKPAQ